MNHKKEFPFVGIYDRTVLLPCVSIASVIIGMISALHGRNVEPLVCLAVCGLCDGFDGRIARTKKNRQECEKIIGIEMDSLCDMVCFGLFPAMLFYCYGMRSIFGVAMIVFYCLCALQRLAFFNMLEHTQNEERVPGYFFGIPVTTISIFMPLVYLLHCILPQPLSTAVLYLASGVFGLLYILEIPVRKFNLRDILLSVVAVIIVLAAILLLKQ